MGNNNTVEDLIKHLNLKKDDLTGRFQIEPIIVGREPVGEKLVFEYKDKYSPVVSIGLVF